MTMKYIENSAIKSLDSMNIVDYFYCRFVDDLFFMSGYDYFKEIFEAFDQVSDNIRMEFEKEKDGILSFLDVKLIKYSGYIDTTVFVKPMYSGIIIHYNSYVPDQYKRNTLSMFVNRAFQVCSNETLFDKELIRIKDLFLDNGYPPFWIDKENKRILENIYCNDSQNEFKKLNTYCSIPFNSNLYPKIKRILRSVNIGLTSCPSNSLKKMFECKGRNNDNPLNRRSVVYALHCINNDCFYIGNTMRELRERVQDHKRALKNEDLQYTTVKHVINTGHKIDFENPGIIITERNNYKRLVMESVIIDTMPCYNERVSIQNVKQYGLSCK